MSQDLKLQSMTGFARASSTHSGAAISWELKSVNGKTLEARLHLPPGFDRLEIPVRQALQKLLARGNVQASLTLSRPSAEALPTVNHTLLRELARHAQAIQSEFDAAPATSAELLSLRGVLEAHDRQETEDERTALDQAVMATFQDALSSLVYARAQEGVALGAILNGQLEQIEALTARVQRDPSREPSAIKARLAEQVRLLLETNLAVDETRLAMEAAILATKADIREELDRLTTHIAAARALLATGGPIGRKLDFLAQEFNRESNTLCSKSNAGSVTALGLELKVVIDQFREQIQNLE